jgi:branched-subunit amino acid ABC-type transport system permease component
VNAQWNYWAALIVAAVATGLGAALIGVGAHWRFPNRANANSSVTLPLALTLFIAAALIAAQTRPGAAFPSPPGLPTFAVGPLLITAPYMGLLIFAPALIVFTVVVDYWPARRWPVAVSWALVGVVACTVVLLAAPTLGFAGPDIGSIQLLPAMVVAGLAGFRRRGIAVVGGLALGVTEQYLLWNWPRSEATFWLFGGLLILSALIRTQRKSNALARHQLPPPPPREPRSAHRTRRVLTATVVTGAFIALGLTAILDHNPAQLILAAASASFCLVSSSQLATEPGRLELGLPGYMTVGILFGRLGTLATGNLLLPIALATLTGAITGAIIGRIARPSYSWRIPIVTLGVTLLAFASFSLLYDQGFSPLPLDLFGVMLNQSPRAWLWTSIALLALGLAAANRIGRRTPSTMNYAIAGAVAAVGGFAYSATLSDVDAEAVSLSLAFQLLAIALVGGTYAPLVPC